MKLNNFDLFCLNMVIKGAWVFDTLPPFETLKSSLLELLSHYPHLNGHYDEASKSIVSDGGLEGIVFEEKDCRAASRSDSPYQLVPAFDIKGFKEGKVKPFSAWLLHLQDGDALVVQCAHAAMDGYSFYNLVKQWGEQTRGVAYAPMAVAPDTFPSNCEMPKDEVLQRVIAEGWTKMSLGKLAKMLFNTVRNFAIKGKVVLEVPQQEIDELKARTGAGTNAVLCAIACKNLFKADATPRTFSILEVANCRQYLRGIPHNFFGNCSQPVSPTAELSSSASVEELAKQIQNEMKSILQEERVDSTLRLSLHAPHYSLPYNNFDPTLMNCPDPKIIYINNQLSLPALEADFGTGAVARVEEAELGDFVKFWRSCPGGPVQIIYRGFAVKMLK